MINRYEKQYKKILFIKKIKTNLKRNKSIQFTKEIYKI